MTRLLERWISDTSERLRERQAGREERVAERVVSKVTERMGSLMAEMDARIATLEVLTDEDALGDLRASSRDSYTDLRDYDEIRREAGLA